MASGHSSKNHEVYVHQLVPKTHIFNKLVGHPRTPWCLTFDRSCSYILYSGCLGGVVNKWNVKSGTLLESFNSGMSTPINSIVFLPNNPAYILVAMKHALYLVSSEEGMQVVWKSENFSGRLCQVKYWDGRNKLLAAFQVPTSPVSYRLQIHDFNLKVPTDMTKDRAVHYQCSLSSPRCLATSDSIICCDGDGSVLMCAYCSDSDWHKQCLYAIGPSDIQHNLGPRVTFMAVSPCEKYLLVGIKEYKPVEGMGVIILVDLERKGIVMKERYPEVFNCGRWMPPSGAYGMGVCLGNNVGNLKMLRFRHN